MLKPILCKPYTPAVSTDIRATFQLERERLASLQQAGQAKPGQARQGTAATSERQA